jgi:predicted nucleic acid-binding protein
MFLLDTNVISDARKQSPHSSVCRWFSRQDSHDMYLCAVTVLEIQRGITLADKRGDKAQAEFFTRWLDDHVLPEFAGRILPIDHLIARQAARLDWAGATDYRDSLIAATAILHGATVVTRNTRHFAGMGVQLVNPWE